MIDFIQHLDTLVGIHDQDKNFTYTTMTIDGIKYRMYSPIFKSMFGFVTTGEPWEVL